MHLACVYAFAGILALRGRLDLGSAVLSAFSALAGSASGDVSGSTSGASDAFFGGCASSGSSLSSSSPPAPHPLRLGQPPSSARPLILARARWVWWS